MNQSALTIACLFLAGLAQADVHTWRDADGVTHFSDRVVAQADTSRRLTPAREPVSAGELAGENIRAILPSRTLSGSSPGANPSGQARV